MNQVWHVECCVNREEMLLYQNGSKMEPRKFKLSHRIEGVYECKQAINVKILLVIGTLIK